MPVKKASKTRIPVYVCPACGSAEMSECHWSGQIGHNGEDEYQGWWIECLGCGLQGPEKVWTRMAKRRSDIRRALGLTDPATEHQQQYMVAIEEFGQLMFRELVANDPKKGDFLTWAPTKDQAVSELEHHFFKIVGALNRGKKTEVTEYSADMGNIAMAVARQLGVK